MCVYDMASEADKARLALDAAMQGRVDAIGRPLTEGCDCHTVRAKARTLCGHALAEIPDLTNDPEAYHKLFVIVYTQAYLQRRVHLRHNLGTALQSSRK